MITIIDYGLGNINAFANLYKKLDVDVKFAKTVNDLVNATKIILPGVGAFDHAMKTLNSSGMREKLDELVLEKQCPVIGICVGMQMMANSSEEGDFGGLGWIPGKVKKFTGSSVSSETDLPLPHMGWNSLNIIEEDSELFQGLDDSKQFYFLHSYYFQPDNDNHVLATSNYACQYASVINRDNVFGIQCHPEKSHHNGVAILKNFASF
ncbi:MAG: imidazole glycerol phosphate synthase subunit HisH [Alteromonadaceae bacterium]|nr:imidazole glycerol phosphate synthase subunit HisH [Alteromonadaceae bacterium]